LAVGNQLGVAFLFLDVIEGFPAGDDDALGRIASERSDIAAPHNKATAGILDGLDRGWGKFLFIFGLIGNRLLGDKRRGADKPAVVQARGGQSRASNYGRAR
jgi:hypothetical protein